MKSLKFQIFFIFEVGKGKEKEKEEEEEEEEGRGPVELPTCVAFIFKNPKK